MDERAYVSTSVAEGATSYAFDGRGSVTAALDGSGSLAGIAAFGVTGTIEAAAGTLPSRGWNAEEADAATGLVYLRARFLVTATLSFASQDTYLGQAASPASQMRYAYAEGDPVNAIDPTGHYTVPKSQPMLRREMEYKEETQRRQREALLARQYPEMKPAIYARRDQYRYEHPNGPGTYRMGAYDPGAQQGYTAEMLAAMPAGSQRSYYAWTWYKNGWITQEAAEKYCTGVLRMDLEAENPSSGNQASDAIDALNLGISLGSEATRGGIAAGDIAGSALYGGVDYGKAALDAASGAIKSIGKRFIYIQLAVDGCVVLTYMCEAWNDPNLPPDRAMTDAIAELMYGSVKTATDYFTSFVSGIPSTSEATIVASVLFSAEELARYQAEGSLEEHIKARLKDAIYDAIYH